jgi:hypothetical protein
MLIMICARCGHGFAEHCGSGCSHVSAIEFDSLGDDFVLLETSVYCNCPGFQSEE